MKKLLVTAIGAAAALGAYAGVITGDPLRFNTFELGSVTTNELNDAHGWTHWTDPTTATNTYAIETMGSYKQRQEAAISTEPTKALSVKTTFGNPLTVNIKADGTATNIAEKGIYFDSLVKFTVCEDAPDQTYDGAKIVMWLQEEYEGEEISCTNLYVRAGYLTVENGDLQVSNAVYNCGEIAGNFADEFHRVTIKAISNITEASDPVPGFAIYIDGNDEQGGLAVGTGSVAKWDSTFTAAYTLTEAAGYLADPARGALFPSLDQSTGAKSTLTAASFDGTGSITDIIFTDTAPSFAKDYVARKANVTIGETTTEYDTLADAIAAVNAGTGATSPTEATLQLMKGLVMDGTEVAPIEINFANANVTNVVFDFAGKVITNTTAYCAITNKSGSAVTFVDTVGGGGITCTSGESTAGALYVSGAKSSPGVTMEDGIFRGAIKAATILVKKQIHIDGGWFLASDVENLTGCLTAGKKFGSAEDGICEVVDIVYYTVGFYDDVQGEGSLIGTEASVEAGTLATAPAAPTKTGYTFVDWTPSTNTAITANTDFYPTWTANNYSITYYDGESALELTPATYTFGTGATLPASAGTKAGYDFAGWYDNAQFTGEAVTAVAANATGDKAFYAKYTATPYTITYKEPDGTAFTRWADQFSAPATFTVESVVTLPVANNVNLGTGATFNGWTNAVGKVVTTTENLTANLEVFAKITEVVQPTYPSYLDNADADVKGQYNTWKTNNSVADGDNDYEAAFLLNVAPDGDTTLDATAVNISGTTVTITLDHTSFNGYVYLYSATTVAGLDSVTPTLVTPESGVISATSSDAAKFYKVVVSSTQK